jgi:nitrogen fixation/metabolism regulation signal transduction histidine kinase
VASGDLQFRVAEESPGDFGWVAQTFNRMTRELERAEEQRRNLTAVVAMSCKLEEMKLPHE